MVQDTLLSLGEGGCLLLCYSKLADIELNNIIQDFDKLVLNDVISFDCYVKDADKLLSFYNKNGRVKKVNISDVKENQKYIASWEYNGNNHFVIMQNDKVIYNTLSFSKCVKYGKMNKVVRVIEWK